MNVLEVTQDIETRASISHRLEDATKEKKRQKDRDPSLAKRFPDRYGFSGEEIPQDYRRIEVQQSSEAEPATMRITIGEGDNQKTLTVEVKQRIWAIDKNDETKSGKCFVVTKDGDIISLNARPSNPNKNEHNTDIWKLGGAKLIHAEGFKLSDTASEMLGNPSFPTASLQNDELHKQKDHEELQDILNHISPPSPTE